LNHGRVPYSELTLRYFRDAPNAGVLHGPNIGFGTAGTRGCGTEVRFHVQVVDDRIPVARFQAYGCPHVIAVAAWLSEHSTGKPANAALPESIQALQARFSLPAEKLGRLLIVEDAWIAAIRAAVTKSKPVLE